MAMTKKGESAWQRIYLDDIEEKIQPRVLLVGDAISENCCRPMNRMLNGRVHVDVFSSSKAINHPGLRAAIELTMIEEGHTDLIIFCNGMYGLSLPSEEYEKAYEEMIRFFLTKVDRNRLILQTVTPVTMPNNVDVLYAAKNNVIRDRNRILRELSEKYSLTVCDLYQTIFSYRELRMPDGVYYLDAGYSMLGAKVVSAIRRALDIRRALFSCPGKLVLVGGGEMQKAYLKMIEMTGEQKPRVLIVPTASHDNMDYARKIGLAFRNLGCAVDLLTLCGEKRMEPEIIHQKIMKADIIYIGGGETAYLMRVWEECGVTEEMKEAYSRGIVMGGVSAGAVCLCINGYNEYAPDHYGLIDGLGFAHLSVCPHFQDPNWHRFEENLKTTEEPIRAIALENNAAVCAVDGSYEVIRGGTGGKVWLYIRGDEGWVRREVTGHLSFTRMPKDEKI